MPVVIALDGSQHFTTESYGNIAGSIFEIKFKTDGTSKNIGLVAASPTATSAYVRFNSSGYIRARGQQTGTNTAPPNGINIFDGEWHVLRVHYYATSHQFELDGFLSAINNQNVMYGAWNALFSFYTNAKLQGEVEYAKWINNGSNNRVWDASASDHSAGSQPVLTDIENSKDAQGFNFEVDGSAWVDVGGEALVFVGSISVDNISSIVLSGLKSKSDYVNFSLLNQALVLGKKHISAQSFTSNDSIIDLTGSKSVSQQLHHTATQSTLVAGKKGAFSNVNFANSVSYSISGIADNIIRKSASLALNNNALINFIGSKSVKSKITCSQNSFIDVSGFKHSYQAISTFSSTTFIVSGIANNILRKTGSIEIMSTFQNSVSGRKSSLCSVGFQHITSHKLFGSKLALASIQSTNDTSIALFIVNDFVTPLIRSITIEAHFSLLQIPCNLDNTITIKGKF